MKLKDQVAIVTGAGRNIGEEVARLFAAEGAKVAVVDLDKPRGERVAAAIRQAGGEAELFAADVSEGSDVAALVKARGRRASAASISWSTTSRSPTTRHIFDITEEDWDRVHDGDAQEPVSDGASTSAQQMVGAGHRRPHRQCRLDLGLAGPRRARRLFGRQGRRSPISRARWRCSWRRTRSGSTRSCRTRSARRSARTSSIRRGRCRTCAKRAGQPQEAAKAMLFLVSEDSSFVYRRQPVRRRRHHGDGFVVMRAPPCRLGQRGTSRFPIGQAAIRA